MREALAIQKPLWRRAAKTLVAGAFAVAAGMALWAGFLQLSGNIHEVEPGILYRSAQLAPHRLETFIGEHKIRTVINLRGQFAGTPWFDAEAAAVRGSGATLISFPMSANQEPSEEVLVALIRALRTAPRPILIHCNAGADRTGLASALFELLVNGRRDEEAEGQLSFRYGHFPWLTSRTGAMDRTFEWVVASQDRIMKVSADAAAQ